MFAMWLLQLVCICWCYVCPINLFSIWKVWASAVAQGQLSNVVEATLTFFTVLHRFVTGVKKRFTLSTPPPILRLFHPSMPVPYSHFHWTRTVYVSFRREVSTSTTREPGDPEAEGAKFASCAVPGQNAATQCHCNVTTILYVQYCYLPYAYLDM